MALAIDEFEELLNAEQEVDTERLCSIATHGIPEKVTPNNKDSWTSLEPFASYIERQSFWFNFRGKYPFQSC
jgi:hypothetical protein